MTPKLLLGVTACGVPQGTVEALGLEVRRALGPLGLDLRTVLFLDTPDGVSDFDRLGRAYDRLVFNPERMGLGTARSAALEAAGDEAADLLLIMDGDGQYGVEGLVPLVRELTGTGPDVIFPLRDRRSLPLAGGGRLNRLIAERFENYVVATAAGRPEYRWWDLQPGAFALRSSAVAATRGQVESRGFSWDLEFSFRLLSSPLGLAQMPVAVRPQTATLFTAQDFEAVLAYLFASFSPERVAAALAAFLAEDRVRAEFSREDTETLSAIVGTIRI
jgi:hypothetical protein